MSIADLFVIAIVVVLFAFILWANLHHRRKVGRATDARSIPNPDASERAGN